MSPGAVEKVGATKDRDIICSCGTGREATNELLLFKYYLGYPSVRIYEAIVHRMDLLS